MGLKQEFDGNFDAFGFLRTSPQSVLLGVSTGGFASLVIPERSVETSWLEPQKDGWGTAQGTSSKTNPIKQLRL